METVDVRFFEVAGLLGQCSLSCSGQMDVTWDESTLDRIRRFRCIPSDNLARLPIRRAWLASDSQEAPTASTHAMFPPFSDPKEALSGSLFTHLANRWTPRFPGEHYHSRHTRALFMT